MKKWKKRVEKFETNLFVNFEKREKIDNFEENWKWMKLDSKIWKIYICKWKEKQKIQLENFVKKLKKTDLKLWNKFLMEN